jgi:hypothetical protein
MAHVRSAALDRKPSLDLTNSINGIGIKLARRGASIPRSPRWGRSQALRVEPVGFSFARVGCRQLQTILPFKPILLGRDRRIRLGKSGGPPLLAPSLKVEGDSAHDRNLRVRGPSCDCLNAHGALKVQRRGVRCGITAGNPCDGGYQPALGSLPAKPTPAESVDPARGPSCVDLRLECVKDWVCALGSQGATRQPESRSYDRPSCISRAGR